MSASDIQKIRVLVVDDDKDVLETMQLHLTEMGFLVLPASSAEEAKKTLLSTPSVDAVLTDLRMPGCGGLELLKQIRGEVPGLVIVTAFADIVTSEEAKGYGVYRILLKPVERNYLYKTVVAAAALTRAERSVAPLQTK